MVTFLGVGTPPPPPEFAQNVQKMRIFAHTRTHQISGKFRGGGSPQIWVGDKNIFLFFYKNYFYKNIFLKKYF